jgi:hypothetical protein
MAVRFPIRTELALGADPNADPSTWSWTTDISDRCYVRGGFSHRRGRADWLSQAQPSGFSLLLNNRDGRFSRLNPTGPYYGQLAKNTPVRVSIDPGSGYVVRATGFVSEWPTEWDVSGADAWVDVRADGVLRRLGQGTSGTKSAAYRTLTAAEPLAYWPCEDTVGASRVAFNPIDPAYNGVAPVPKRATFGELGPPGSDGAVLLVTGEPVVGPYSDNRPALTLPIPPHTAGESVIGLWFAGNPFDETAGAPTDADLATIESWVNFTGGGVGSYLIRFTESRPGAAPLSSYVSFDAFTATNTAGAEVGTEITTSSSGIQLFDGAWHHAQVRMAQNGANVDVTLWLDGAQYASQSLTSVTLGVPFQIKLGVSGAVSGATEVTPNSLFRASTVTVHDDTAAVSGADLYALGAGYPGELAGDRIERLCAEEGVSVDVTAGSTAAMGAQPAGPFVSLLRECEAAEEGMLVERRDGTLGFDPPAARYNLDPALELDYAQRQIFPPFRPADDDLLTRNDVTVTLPDGSFGRVVDLTGPVGVDTVGRYDERVPRNLSADAVHSAGWRVNLGTVDGYRYPSVILKLHAPGLASLRADIVAVDIGSRVTIANPPAYLPPDLIDLVVEGINERADNQAWTVELLCSPYQPYRVGELAQTTSDQSEWLLRLAGDLNAAIRAAIDADDTSILVDPNRTRFTTVADDFDPDLAFRLGGEVIEVSGISTTAGTFVAAGAMSSADNAAVTPALYAGNTTGDLICVLARIRSASAGTLGTPTDYVRLPIVGFDASSPMQLFAKVHDGSESNPTVTPTGGSAGDTVSALTFGLRGTPVTLEDLTDIVVDSYGRANASAQNIAYPGLYPRLQEGCIVLVIGGKDDDWTSVAALSGFTEAADSSTTTGNDQGLVVDYVIQTTPAVINEGSFTVTGGASAVSEGIVVAIAAGYQTLTASARSVNGVVKSHAAGTRIEVEDAKVLAL